MDKEESLNLDVEFNQYLQILKPYLEQLLNEENVKICNAWIQKLSDCRQLDKGLRNKYIFTLCFQLAKGVLSSPFNDYPPNSNLTFEKFSFSSNDSFSDPDTQCTYFIEGNDIIVCDSKSAPKITCQPINSEVTVCSRKLEINNEINDIKNFTRDFLSSSNSTMANCLHCPEILNANFENNIYLRVNNLIDKLREIRKQNSLLNKEIQLLKEESKIKKNLDISSQIHCGTNTDKFDHTEGLRQQCNCNVNLNELKENFEKFKESKSVEFEELKQKHKNDIMNTEISIKIEIQKGYEKQIRELTQKYESKIKLLEERTENQIKQLTISSDKMKVEKENTVAEKNKEIGDLRVELDDIKAQNFNLRNKLASVRNDTNSEFMKAKAFQLERRLYKTEKSKNKRIRAYQVQLICLQHEKNYLANSMHLQLLQQRSELTEEYQKKLITGVEKLEEKYKEIVANVQAAAIQRRINDQMVLDEIIKGVYGNDNELNNFSETHDSQDGSQTEPAKNSTRKKSRPLSQWHRCNDDLTDKTLFNLEDTYITGFCLDEVKLGELFKRVHITQNKSGDEHIDDDV